MAGYVAIPSKESFSLDGSLAEVEESLSLHHKRSPSRPASYLRRTWPWILHLMVFSVSISAGLLVRPRQTCPSTKDALLHDHPWDRTIRLDGTFNRNSPYKGPPSPQVDRAWADLFPMKLMSIPEAVFQTVNTSRFSVETPPYLGKGRLAIFEAFHQIHCVHSLWKAAYPEYYTEDAEFARTNREEWLEHVDHCADMLRQKFMCDADSNLITYSWLKNHYNPHPNFNVEHKCRNYGLLLDAMQKYGIDLDAVPEGGIRRPKFKEVVDFVEPPFDPLAQE